jgi:hypothetical protein
MKLMITQEKDMLIISGLIMKNRRVNMSGRKDSGATWLEEKPKETSSALEESGVETSRDQEETSVAPKG